MVLFNAYNMIVVYNNFKIYFEQLKRNGNYEDQEPLLEKNL